MNKKTPRPKQKTNTQEIGLTLNQVQRAMLRREVINETMVMLLGLPLIVLRDSFGFGRKRLTEFTDEVLKQVKCAENGRVTLKELQDIIYKETGFKIVDK